jgi:hypothetical protein
VPLLQPLLLLPLLLLLLLPLLLLLLPLLLLLLPLLLLLLLLQSEPQLLKMLDEVRHGIWSQQTQQLLRYLARDLAMTDGIQPTELFATNKEVSVYRQYISSIYIVNIYHQYISSIYIVNTCQPCLLMVELQLFSLLATAVVGVLQLLP